MEREDMQPTVSRSEGIPTGNVSFNQPVQGLAWEWVEVREDGQVKYELQRLAEKIVSGDSPDSHLASLGPLLGMNNIDPLVSANQLASLFAWQVVDQEFHAIFRKHFWFDRDPAKREPPTYRVVEKLIGPRVDLEGTTVATYNVRGGYQGESWGFFRNERDQEDDECFMYAHIIARVLWRLYHSRDEQADQVGWLKDPNVVGKVRHQLYIIFHALMYKHLAAIEVWKRENELMGMRFVAAENID